MDEDHSYVLEGIVVHNCDVLASMDWYDLGPGVYPVLKVPAKAHPNDRCELEAVTRALSEIRLEKPNPNRILFGRELDEATIQRLAPARSRRLTPALIERIQLESERAVRFGEEALERRAA